MAFTFKHGDRPLEGYTIQRGVGRGGFGEVYYAISDGGREVALKYLRDNPDVELRGVSQCMNLKSPHLVTVFDVKRSGEGEYFIVMEYVSGPCLRDLLIAEPKGLGPQKAAYFVREIAKGLAYLHDRGIVHRDLKPGNIFYEDGYVKIGDYGLSKFIAVSRHSAQTASVGTVHYMAPEIGSGSYSRGVDIYALGVMLYEMLLGRVPFEGASMGEVLMKHLTEQPEVDELPQPFAQVIRKALAKDPQDRYQTVDEMLDELLGVEDVKRSVVGFDPASLSVVARQAAAAGGVAGADSPQRSPHPGWPAGRGPAGAAPVGGQPVAQAPPAGETAFSSRRLAKRLERIDRKLDRRMERLGHRPRRRAQAGPPMVVKANARVPAAIGPFSWSDVARSAGLCALIMVGLSIGVGLAAAAFDASGDEAAVAGASTFLTVLLTLGGVGAVRWFGARRTAAGQVPAVPRPVIAVCCLPLMLAGIAPMLAELTSEECALAVLGALFITVGFTRWDELFAKGAKFELDVGPVIRLALLATVLAAVFQAEEFTFVATGVIAAVTLCAQVLSRVWQPRGQRAAAQVALAGGSPPPAAAAFHPPDLPPGSPPASPAEAVANGGSGVDDVPPGIPLGQRVAGVRKASRYPLAPMRSTFIRGFWSVVAFLLAGGMIALFITPLMVDLSDPDSCRYVGRGAKLSPQTQVYYYDMRGKQYVGPVAFAQYRAIPREHRGSPRIACTDYSAYMGVITGCVACFSFLIFALGKTTRRRRPGYWRETLRPFLIAVAMTGLGAAITALATPNLLWHDEERIGTVVGLVFSALLFLVLLVARGRRPRPTFFMPAAAAMPVAAPDAPAATPPGAPNEA